MFAYQSAVEYLQIDRPGQRFQGVRESAPAELVAVDHLLPSAVTTLTQRLGVPEAEVVKMAGMATRTWHTRKASNAALSPREADGILRIARIAAETLRVFGNEDKARRWLAAPFAGFGGRSPFELLDSDAGVQAVEEELGRIHWGDTF